MVDGRKGNRVGRGTPWEVLALIRHAGRLLGR